MSSSKHTTLLTWHSVKRSFHCRRKSIWRPCHCLSSFDTNFIDWLILITNLTLTLLTNIINVYKWQISISCSLQHLIVSIHKKYFTEPGTIKIDCMTLVSHRTIWPLLVLFEFLWWSFSWWWRPHNLITQGQTSKKCTNIRNVLTWLWPEWKNTKRRMFSIFPSTDWDQNVKSAFFLLNMNFVGPKACKWCFRRFDVKFKRLGL